ncbi:MAG: hypothetical protein KDK12_12360 [Rhodobacteraceae bacterium]|nr:hypothetical protein [Paracoccaceae bacterium]
MQMNCLAALTLTSFLMSAITWAAHASNLGCAIDLRLRNVSGEAVDADIRSFQVRSRVALVAGPWRRVQNGGWQPAAVTLRIAPGHREMGTYETELLCQDPRQYRVDYTCRSGRRQGQTFDVRHPENGWAGGQLAVVEIGRRCD